MAPYSSTLAWKIPWTEGLVSAMRETWVRSLGWPGLGKPARGGHGNPFQYSCLENPMGRGGWQAPVHGVAKSGTRLSD